MKAEEINAKQDIHTITFSRAKDEKLNIEAIAISFFYKDLELGFYIINESNYHQTKKDLIEILKYLINMIDTKEVSYNTLKDISETQDVTNDS